MRQALAVLVWLLVIALQVSLWPQISGIQPAFTLAAALAVGLTPANTVTGPARAHIGSSSTLWTGFWLALISGAVLGLYAQNRFGMILAASALGYAAIWLVIRPPIDDLRWPNRLSAAALAALIYELIVIGIVGVTTKNFPFFAELATVATLNVLGTVTAFAIFAAILGAFRRRFT